MRIDDVNQPAQAPPTERTERAGEQANKQGTSLNPSRNSSDQVDISPLANVVNSGDAQRLEQLRLQVKAGTYQVNADVVAKSMIDEHLKP